MKLWRISKKEYANLSGTGGLHGPGRWHKEGHPVVYLSEHPALAQLEILVHMDVKMRFLTDYVLMSVNVPDEVSLKDITASGPDINDQEKCQTFGTHWLQQNDEVLLKVRSAIVPHSFNYILNPMHQKAQQVKIAEIIPFNMDRRLFA